jgi:hypothetical protein
MFLEPSHDVDWLKSVKTFREALSDLIAYGYVRFRHRLRCPCFGFKLRCGGPERSAFPSLGRVAFSLSDIGYTRFKATAGLHHPLRRYDKSLGTYMHGFLNVWIAALGLSQGSDKFDTWNLLALLEDEDASNFVFDDQGVNWRDQKLPTEFIAKGRTQITSFGSCSFDEPRDDLRAMGLLP